jgi:Predicted pyridoxal phosphate-dependent enzyme apparently involved in regulation of cell wall biogenesis
MKKELNLQSILQGIRSVLPVQSDFTALHEPMFNGNEWAYVKGCLDSGWVSSVGRFVERFEQQLAEYSGLKYAVAAVNGTAALHICLCLADISVNDEVLVPALTFIATANAVSYCGAIPHLIDSEETTLGVDPGKLDKYLDEISERRPEGCINLKTGRLIRAVIAMHAFGHPVDMEPLAETCRKHGLILIEDGAESLGSQYKGKHMGNWGLVSSLSFNGNKIVTTGGGGAILTNHQILAQLARHLTTQAKMPHPWGFNHDMVGYNYRMPNINAALGCAQLEQITDFIARKRTLADRYQKALKDIEGVKMFREAFWAHSNYWLNVLLIDDEYCHQRDQLLALTASQGIMTRPCWTLMHKQPMYSNCPHMDLTVAESLERRIVNLPSSAVLADSD